MYTTKRSNVWRTVIVCMSLILLQFNSAFVYADGSEALGPPSISIGSGTGIVVAGVGLAESQPGSVDFNIPAGADIVQVLVYWEGYQNPTEPPALGDPNITVNGNPVTGTLIGGPLSFENNIANSTAYRADITSLDLVVTGANSLSIGGMDFTKTNHGAGVLVIINDNVSDLADIDLRDGNDFAYGLFSTEVQMTTMPQTFNFAPSPDPRTAYLELMFASVFGTASSGGAGIFRPTAIEVSVDGGPPTVFNNLLDSVDGQEWDSISVDVPVPAGATSVTVQALSVDNGAPIPPDTTRGNVASFHWISAGLAITPPPPPPGAYGCTPGFFKNIQKHLPAWVDYTPGQQFSSVFENAFPGMTLLDVLMQGGGGLEALGRHTVAALLNGANSDINYGRTDAQVIAAFNAVYPGEKSEYTALKNEFADDNERGCPINGKTAPE